MSTRLQWHASGNRLYHYGVDRGVVFIGENPGVAWDGLIRVSRVPSGGEARPSYLDGLRYFNDVGPEEYEASIEAMYSPPEFDQCDGTLPLREGLFATNQVRKEFDFSYRTLVGNDITENAARKIHLIYNAMALPAGTSNLTLDGNPSADVLAWGITTRPVESSRLRIAPTAYFVLDGTQTPNWLMEAVEDILYGTDVEEARMPTIEEIMDLVYSGTDPDPDPNPDPDPGLNVGLYDGGRYGLSVYG